MNSTRFGFRVVGDLFGARRLVDADAAFRAYAACDSKAQVDGEAYLSAFRFGDDFRELLDAAGSVRGFDGPCATPWLWLDVDRADLETARQDVRKLAAFVVERYGLEDSGLLAFFSGSKGFHLGLPLAVAGSPPPSSVFHRVCRRLAEGIAERAGVAIDSGVYDRVRAFRAPNSRHPKTGLRKRRLALDELRGLTLAEILDAAKSPLPFDLPTPSGIVEQLAADWQSAAELVATENEAKAERRASRGGSTLNRSTLAFIRNGATNGDRHRLLFSAAANLGELGCSFELAAALLADAALDSGLAPRDVERQIRCGLSAVASPAPVAGDATPSAATTTSPTSNDSTAGPPVDDMGERLAKLWATAANDATGLTDTAKGTPAVDSPPARPATATTSSPPARPAATPSGSTSSLTVAARASLVALWDSTTTERTGSTRAPTPTTDPPPRPNAKPGPTPPPGARLFFADARLRACSPSTAELWTFEGCAEWFRVAEFSPPGRAV